MEESKENFKKIKSANQMMLDYFNKSFLSQLEDIQNLKTQILKLTSRLMSWTRRGHLRLQDQLQKKRLFSCHK